MNKEQIFNFIRDNKPTGKELFEWGMDNDMIETGLAEVVQSLIKDKKVKQFAYCKGVNVSMKYEAI